MQSIRSILLHLDSSARCPERVRIALELAEAFDAEVTGLPCTLSALMRYPYALEGAAEAVQIMQQLDRESRDTAHAVFVDGAKGSPRLHWSEPLPDALRGFARRALYCDLVVLGQHDGSDPVSSELPPDFLASLLVDSGRPALVLPHAGPITSVGTSVLIAWKETREAARAVSAALPWLRRAKAVHAVSYGEDAGASLQALQTYLAPHGVVLRPHVGDPAEGDAGGKLLSVAADLGADLLVMGCYGHSRAREWVWGGATRAILASMTLPVLMCH